MNETKSKVYLIEVCGNDYYDRLEFFGVYADREAAEARAAELWTKQYEDNEEGELLYEEVIVSEVPIL
jgi:hypothetical protein